MTFNEKSLAWYEALISICILLFWVGRLSNKVKHRNTFIFVVTVSVWLKHYPSEFVLCLSQKSGQLHLIDRLICTHTLISHILSYAHTHTHTHTQYFSLTHTRMSLSHTLSGSVFCVFINKINQLWLWSLLLNRDDVNKYLAFEFKRFINWKLNKMTQNKFIFCSTCNPNI